MGTSWMGRGALAPFLCLIPKILDKLEIYEFMTHLMGFYLPFISNFRQMPPIRRSCSVFVHELVPFQLPRNPSTPQRG